MAEINLDMGLSPELEHSRPNSDHNLNPLRRGVFDKSIKRLIEQKKLDFPAFLLFLWIYC
jgi:hypothetical protein